MDSNSYCDPCSGEGTSLAAIRFCSDCEERLCKDCVEYHQKFKATKSHHLIDLSSIVKYKIPIAKKFCEVHPDIPLDFYCTQHDTVCCRACIPSYHQSCKDILLLEDASKHIKQSSLFEDTLSEWQNIGKTLDHFRTDRNDNVGELEKVESSILVEIGKWKNHLIKQINTYEEKLKTDFSNAKKKNLEQLRKENSEISELKEVTEGRKQELEFLKEHGSNNQLYLSLREQGKGVQNVVKRMQEMTLSYKKAVFKFVKTGDIDIESIGSVLETKEACDVKHSPVKLQQAQVQPGRVKPLPTTFKREITRQLNCRDRLNITDIAVTTDEKVLFCNYFTDVCKVYVYHINQDNLARNTTFSFPSAPYGISIFTGSDQAVVTIPRASYVQFINTKMLTLHQTLQVGEGCYGITTNGNFFAVAKTTEITILKQNGEIIKTIMLSGKSFSSVCSLLYNHQDGYIIYRQKRQVRRIRLDGTVVYQYEVSGEAGLAIDAQGHVYLNEYNENEIQRLLPNGGFPDVVLTGKDGITQPYAITFNKSYTKFFVANNAGLVQVYNCK